MQKQLFLFSTACAALALVGWRAGADEVVFAPADGTTVTKTFVTEFEMELDDFAAIVAGQDVGSMLGTPEMTMVSRDSVTFTDEYGDVSEGRVGKLTRRFDSLGSEATFSVTMMGESDEQGTSMTSPLEGLAVVFAWNAEEDDYDVRFAEDSTGDDSLLDDLTADTDLRGLLPSGAVEVDESWSFEPTTLEALLVPSGDLGWETDDIPEADMAEFEEMFEEFTDEAMALGEELMAGEGTATYKGTREVDGRKVAAIELSVEIGSSADLSDLLSSIAERAMEEGDAPDDAEIDIETADLSIDLDAEGELLWDLATGTVHTLTLSGDFDIALDVSIFASGDGEEMDFEVSVAFSGPFMTEVSTER